MTSPPPEGADGTPTTPVDLPEPPPEGYAAPPAEGGGYLPPTPPGAVDESAPQPVQPTVVLPVEPGAPSSGFPPVEPSVPYGGMVPEGTPAIGAPAAAAPYPANPYPVAPYPPGAYPAAPYAPVAYTPPPPTNGFAVAALVCGLLGLVIVLSAPLAIVFALIALPQIKRTGQQGKGMAIAGLVLGIVILVLTIIGAILIILMVRAFSNAVDTRGLAMQANLASAAASQQEYKLDNGRFARTISELATVGYRAPDSGYTSIIRASETTYCMEGRLPTAVYHVTQTDILAVSGPCPAR